MISLENVLTGEYLPPDEIDITEVAEESYLMNLALEDFNTLCCALVIMEAEDEQKQEDNPNDEPAEDVKPDSGQKTIMQKIWGAILKVIDFFRGIIRKIIDIVRKYFLGNPRIMGNIDSIGEFEKAESMMASLWGKYVTIDLLRMDFNEAKNLVKTYEDESRAVFEQYSEAVRSWDQIVLNKQELNKVRNKYIFNASKVKQLHNTFDKILKNTESRINELSAIMKKYNDGNIEKMVKEAKGKSGWLFGFIKNKMEISARVKVIKEFMQLHGKCINAMKSVVDVIKKVATHDGGTVKNFKKDLELDDNTPDAINSLKASAQFHKRHY